MFLVIHKVQSSWLSSIRWMREARLFTVPVCRPEARVCHAAALCRDGAAVSKSAVVTPLRLSALSHLSNSNVSALGIRWTTGYLARSRCQGCEDLLYLLELLSNLVTDMLEMFSVRAMFHKGISRYFVPLFPTDMGLHFASNSVCSPQSLQPRGMTVT